MNNKRFVDWASGDPLSSLLHDQIHVNLSLFHNILSTYSYRDELYEKFVFLQDFHLELIVRDSYAMKQEDFNVNTYAVVLLYKGEYYGHICTRVSPVDSDLCFTMGIRGRIDLPFIRDRKLYSIAGILLEGVRLFGVHMGCRSINIVNPFPIMENRSLDMGFNISYRQGRYRQKYSNGTFWHRLVWKYLMFRI